jgi:hypothetical protein
VVETPGKVLDYHQYRKELNMSQKVEDKTDAAEARTQQT